MKENELEDVRQTLFDNFLQIVSLLFDPARDHKKNYRPLSIYLFNSLIDDSYPMLLKLAEYMNKPLMIIAYQYYDKGIDRSSCVLELSPMKTLPHWPSYIDGPVVPISSYLSQIIGVTPVEIGKGVEYTPAMILRHLRNKDTAHFNANKPDYYQSLKGLVWHDNDTVYEGILIQNVVYSLSTWLYSAILFLLCPKMLEEQTLLWRANTQNESYINIESLDLIVNLRFLRKRFDTTIFNGTNCITSQYRKELIQSYCSVSSIIMFPETTCKGDEQILQILLSQNKDILLGLSKKDDDTLVIVIGNLRIPIKFTTATITHWNYFVFHIVLERTENWYLKLYINRKQICNYNVSEVIMNDVFDICEYCIGNTFINSIGAIFLCNEIIVNRTKLTELELFQLVNRLWAIPYLVET